MWMGDDATRSAPVGRDSTRLFSPMVQTFCTGSSDFRFQAKGPNSTSRDIEYHQVSPENVWYSNSNHPEYSAGIWRWCYVKNLDPRVVQSLQNMATSQEKSETCTGSPSAIRNEDQIVEVWRTIPRKSGSKHRSVHYSFGKKLCTRIILAKDDWNNYME